MILNGPRVTFLISYMFGTIILTEATAFKAAHDTIFCVTRANGIYAEPSDCAAFYSCFNGKTYHFTCPPGLRFDTELQVCTWKAKCRTAAVTEWNSSENQTVQKPNLIKVSPVGPSNITQASVLEETTSLIFSDAKGVTTECFGQEEVRCADGNTCISRAKVCDTVRDCPEGGTDEHGCDVRADKFASQSCKPENCVLPSCFCSADGLRIPNNLGLTTVPQMVLLAFPGALNTQNYELTRSLFLPIRLNPNQCQIRGTFFASHEYSDYSQIEKLHKNGHEIALSTLSRDRESQHWWTTVSSYKDWAAELQSQRQILHNFAHMPLTDIRGAQAPNLHLSGNTQFAVMQDYGYEWDGSITVPSTGRPVWPYKLTFSVPHACHQAGCPTRPYNIWEVPINQLVDSQGFGCSSLGSCRNDDLKSSDEVLQWLLNKFNRHYMDNRAPLVLLIDPTWLQDNHQALSRFIETLITKPEQDTYFVTYHQLIQWMQQPTAIGSLADFSAWSCEEPSAANLCEPINCDLPFVHGGTRRFRACIPSCPLSFPWKDNLQGGRKTDGSAKRYVQDSMPESMFNGSFLQLAIKQI